MKILCLKDIEANRKLLSTLFEGKGHDIAFAEDAIDACRKLEQFTSLPPATDANPSPTDVLSMDRNWRSFFKSATAGLAVIDGQQRFVYLNETLAKMNGYLVSEHLGKTMREILPELADTLEGFHSRVMTGESILNIEFSGEVPSDPGTPRQWSASYFPIFGNCEKPTGMGAIVVDVTERHRAEKALREKEQLFRQVTETIQDVFWMTAEDMADILYVSPIYETIWGRKLSRLKTNPLDWLESIVIEDRSRVFEAFKKIDGSQKVTVEYRILRPDGSIRWIHDTGFPVLDETGKMYRVTGIARDITEQKKAHLRDEAFASLGRHLSAATNQREAGQIIASVSDKIFGWDCYTFDIYSDEEDKVSSILYFDCIDQRRVEVAGAGNVPTRRQKRVIKDGPLLILREPPYVPADDAELFGDMNRLSASIMCVPIRNGAKTLGLLSIQSYKPKHYSNDDLNVLQHLAEHCSGALERIKAEEKLRSTAEQLRQAQKMEAVGRLAGGVAHDFNNLLTVITGYSDVLLFDESLSKEKADQIKEISAAAHRAAGLTRQLLAFSRKQKITLKPVSLNELIEDVQKMLRRIIGEDVRLENSFAPRLPLILADTGMMEQILMNLAVNARDAMPNGGKLFINTDAVTVTPDYVRHNSEARPGKFVCLTVRDTGCGMSPEILARLFEPFFTTKDQGKGTGLGLATVYGITQQHEGWIEVESAVDAGTAFKLFFPTTEKKNAMDQSTVRPKIRGGTETILLVEDDAGVRSLARHILRRYGYNVIEAQSGVEALKVWDEVGGTVDLLLTDIVMPDGITGPDLAKRLQDKKPGLIVLFTSGYSLTTIGPDVDLRDGENFLQKPYHPDKLATLVRTRLD